MLSSYLLYYNSTSKTVFLQQEIENIFYLHLIAGFAQQLEHISLVKFYTGLVKGVDP